MKNLKVTAFLARPFAGRFPISLDALLMYAIAQRDRLPPDGVEFFPLQLMKIPVEWDERGFFHASVSQIESPIRYSEKSFTKRPVTIERLAKFSNCSKQLNIGSGYHKACFETLRLQMPADLKVVWYCVGDADEILSLLQSIPGLGANSHSGEGKVLRWEIEECEEDFSLFKDGKPMRPLPKGMFPSWRKKRWARLGPPYWLQEGLVECVVP